MAGASIINLDNTSPAAPSGEQNGQWLKGATTGNDPVYNYPVYPVSVSVPMTGGAVVKTASYAALASDCGRLLIFNSSGALTLTLPATAPVVPAASTPSQWVIFVQCVGTGGLTISPNGLNLDGVTSSLSLTLAEGIYIATDGTNYWTSRGVGGGGGGFTNPMTTLGDIIVGGASGTPERLGVGTNGQVATSRSGATYGIDWETVIRTLGWQIGAPGSGVALTTANVSAALTVPFACTIVGWNIALGSGDSGTVTVKVWKVAAGTAIPTSANSINTSGVSLSTGTAVQSTTVTDFTTTTISANDLIIIAVTAISGTVACVNFELKVSQS